MRHWHSWIYFTSMAIHGFHNPLFRLKGLCQICITLETHPLYHNNFTNYTVYQPLTLRLKVPVDVMNEVKWKTGWIVLLKDVFCLMLHSSCRQTWLWLSSIVSQMAPYSLYSAILLSWAHRTVVWESPLRFYDVLCVLMRFPKSPIWSFALPITLSTVSYQWT